MTQQAKIEEHLARTPLRNKICLFETESLDGRGALGPYKLLGVAIIRITAYWGVCGALLVKKLPCRIKVRVIDVYTIRLSCGHGMRGHFL